MYSNHMLKHNGCDLVSKRATVRTIYLFYSQIYSKVFAWFKKDYKCVMTEDFSNSGGDLFNGAQYACVSTRSQVILALVGFGFWGLDLNAQLITAMHCTAHIFNRTEWLQDFIALLYFIRKNAGFKSRPSYIVFLLMPWWLKTRSETTVVYQKP